MCSSAAAPRDGINSLSPTSKAGGSGGGRSFPKEARLSGRSNFLAVMAGKTSQRRRGRWLEIAFTPGQERSEETTSAFGISIGRKAGNAVARNRLKRIIREFLRNNKALWPENKMVVIRIKAPVTDETDLIAELKDMLKSLR